MTQHQDAFAAHQRARFMRPDAYRWIRPDAARFLAPGTDPASVYPALEQKFRVDQLRVPKGNGEESGRWMNEGAHLLQAAGDGKLITDVDGHPYYAPGGHHEMPKGVYSKWELSPEARQIFDQSTTGTLPKERVIVDDSGVPRGHYWGGSKGMHKEYNDAIGELSERFLMERRITPEQMTADHAWDLLKEIRESDDPRIRNYNRMIRLLRRVFRFRGGRE